MKKIGRLSVRERNHCTPRWDAGRTGKAPSRAELRECNVHFFVEFLNDKNKKFRRITHRGESKSNGLYHFAGKWLMDKTTRATVVDQGNVLGWKMVWIKGS